MRNEFMKVEKDSEYTEEIYMRIIENIKKDIYEYDDEPKYIVLNTSTLEDKLNQLLINHTYITLPIKRIFKEFPTVEYIIEKAEDRWEMGADLWTIYFKNGNEVCIENNELSKYIDIDEL